MNIDYIQHLEALIEVRQSMDNIIEEKAKLDIKNEALIRKYKILKTTETMLKYDIANIRHKIKNTK